MRASLLWSVEINALVVASPDPMSSAKALVTCNRMYSPESSGTRHSCNAVEMMATTIHSFNRKDVPIRKL